MDAHSPHLLIGDSVTVSSGYQDPAFRNRKATVCTLPRDGKRLVFVKEGKGIKVISVPDDCLQQMPPTSPRQKVAGSEKPYTYFYEDLSSEAAVAEEGPEDSAKAFASGGSPSLVGSETGPDPSLVETFRLSMEDALCVWEFEKLSTIRSISEWREQQHTSSDQRPGIYDWEKPRQEEEIKGKIGTHDIPDKALQKLLNHTAFMFSKKGTKNAESLRLLIELILAWIKVGKLQEAGSLIKIFNRDCMGTSDTRFYRAAIQTTAYLNFKLGDFRAAADMFRKLLAQSGKKDTLYVRENLAFCLLSLCKGSTILEAEAILTEALYTKPGGDSTGSPSPAASPLSFAAAANVDVQEELRKFHPPEFNPAADARYGVILMGLSICKFYKGDFKEALRTIEAAVSNMENHVVNFSQTHHIAERTSPGISKRTDVVLSKAKFWHVVIAKACGDSRLTEIRKSATNTALYILECHACNDLRVATNIKAGIQH
mmetsp:Transcript_14435/g.25956  ORF Transcript_14435/g.25956 Transcript_14435/m.25956 type:complete len:485 (+) Transcript_14435:3-1457(+)